MMDKAALEQWLIRHGYTKDKFGHYQKQFTNGDVIRMKLSNTSVRRERKAKIIDHNEWIRLSSSYYKNLSLTPDDKLSGLKY